MNKTITYEQYEIDMKKRIDNVMEKLYLFEKDEKNSGVRECYEIVKIVMDLGLVSNNLRMYLHNNIPPQYKLINEWLLSIDINRLDSIFSVALLRYTGVIRKNIEYWIDFREKVRIKLQNEGKDSIQILVGLL